MIIKETNFQYSCKIIKGLMKCLKTIPRLSQKRPFFPPVPLTSEHHCIQHTELPDSVFPWFKDVLWTMISNPVSRVPWEPAWQNDQHTWHFWEMPLALLDGNRYQIVADILDFRHQREKNPKRCVYVCLCQPPNILVASAKENSWSKHIPAASIHTATWEQQKGTNLAAVQGSRNI